MERHASPDKMREDLENLLAKINALEVSAPDEYQKGIVKVLRALVEGQKHSISEFEHMKKAIDLLTLQFFETQNKIKS